MIQSIKKQTLWKLQNIKEIKVHTNRKAPDVHRHTDSNKPTRLAMDSFREAGEQLHITKPS